MPEVIIEKGGVMLTLRPSQAAVFADLRGEQFCVLNAPTGWGKSLCLSALAGEDERLEAVLAGIRR